MTFEDFVLVSSTRRCAPRVVSHRFVRHHGARPNLAEWPAHNVMGNLAINSRAQSITVRDQILGRSIRAAGLLHQMQSA
jgi:hypothetical protein